MTRFGARSSGATFEASETNAGAIEIATQSETDTGTDDTRAVTPLKLANYSGLGGGGGATDLDDLTDVVISSPATDDVLTYNGTNWVNDTVPGGGGGGSGNISGAYDIEANTSYTDAGMSDEFASGTLDAQWTASVSSGTIDFPGQPGTGVYDLSSRAGTLLLQPAYSTSAAQRVDLRQADALASGESLVLSCALPWLAKYTSTTYTTIGLLFNSSTTFASGTFNQMRIIVNSSSTNTNAPSVVVSTDSTTLRAAAVDHAVSGRIYLRITRKTINSTDSFVWFYSLDGIAWTPVWQNTATAFTHTWLYAELNTQTSPSIAPVFPINWIRHVASTAHDLW